jgi:hypothetical protein
MEQTSSGQDDDGYNAPVVNVELQQQQHPGYDNHGNPLADMIEGDRAKRTAEEQDQDIQTIFSGEESRANFEKELLEIRVTIG